MATHIRFSDVDGNLHQVYQEVIGWISQKTNSRYVSAREVGKTCGRAHYHIWLEQESTTNVRNNLNNNCPTFKALGRNDKFIKAWGKEGKDIQYFVKGGCIDSSRGFTYEELDGYIQASKEYVKSKKMERAKKGPPSQQLYDRCQIQKLSKMPDIVKEAIRMQVEDRKGINDFALVAWCKTVYIMINGEDALRLIQDKILDKLGIYD